MLKGFAMKKRFLGCLGLIALMLGPIGAAHACIACDGKIETVTGKSFISDSFDPNAQLGKKTVSWKGPYGGKNLYSVTLAFDYSDAGSSPNENWTVFVDTDNNKSNGGYTSVALSGSDTLPITIDASQLKTNSLTYWFEENTYSSFWGLKNYNDGDCLKLNSVKLSFDCTTPVPIPAAAPLFLGGLSLVGWAGRRRRQKTASVS